MFFVYVLFMFCRFLRMVFFPMTDRIVPGTALTPCSVDNVMFFAHHALNNKGRFLNSVKSYAFCFGNIAHTRTFTSFLRTYLVNPISSAHHFLHSKNIFVIINK